MAQQTYPLTVKKKVQECSDACTLVLTPRPEDQNLFASYRPAQFLSFHLDVSNKKLVRSYSLSSSPLLQEELTTTIKKVKDGLVSSYLLDQLKEGDVLYSTRPQGRFYRAPSDLNPRHYFMVAAGSGITPIFSIIKTALSSDDENSVTLIYCNRNESSIIYEKTLKDWEAQHSKRFRIVHVLSQPTNAPTHFTSGSFTGRLNEKILTTILKKYKSHQKEEYYLCGPVELMKMAQSTFLDSGADKKQIHKESFGTVHKKKTAQAPASALVISTDPSPIQEEIKTIKARLEGENIEIPAEPDLPILEQLISAGHCPPFSCMEGNCMTCMAVLKKGTIYQNEPGILDEENIEAKEILTCQAKPLSSIIEVDYDE